MKIFDRVPPWPDRINAVDESNRFAGLNLHQSCCEMAGWYVSARQEPEDETPDKDGPLVPFEESEWEFDKIQPALADFTEDDACTEDVAFRLVLRPQARQALGAIVAPVLWLHLYNHHNGYYAHGLYYVTDDGKQRKVYV